MTNKHKHLEFIQGAVNRFSRNSFLLKGWSVLLVSALFALAADNSKEWLVWLAYMPAVVFWGLDGYYLRQERLLLRLYNHVRGLDEDAIDFDMEVSLVESQVQPWWKVTLSKTLSPFHGVIVGTIIIVTIINKGVVLW